MNSLGPVEKTVPTINGLFDVKILDRRTPECQTSVGIALCSKNSTQANGMVRPNKWLCTSRFGIRSKSTITVTALFRIQWKFNINYLSI
eukprot:3430071-Amphidinium_carterae.1